jgi:hypothetical protein
MKTGRILASVVCLFVALAATPSWAASPASGTLSKAKKQITWKGGPFAASFTTPDPIIGCPGVDACDHFALKADLGEGSRIKITLRTPNPAVEADPLRPYDDYDVYVYAADGSEVAHQITANGNETLTFTHKARWRNKPYDISVDPWLVQPGSTFTATASVSKLMK